jgi:hypothetical protein
MMDTQQQTDIGKRLQEAVVQAAMPDEEGATSGLQNEAKTPAKRRVGDGTPGPGRPKGSVPKVVKTIREAVMEAFDKAGGSEYLYQLSQGTQSDRAAFTSLLNKVLPTQINANVEGGIQVQLSWLGQRQIGTTAAQPVEEVTQVVDLERDSKGKYRIADQQTGAGRGQAAPKPAGGDDDAGR